VVVQVPTSEPTEESTAAPVLTTMEPPAYQGGWSLSIWYQYFNKSTIFSDPIPPKFTEPIKLPSYEQAERTKVWQDA